MIAIQDFREAISALTQVSPSEGVVIRRECADTIKSEMAVHVRENVQKELHRLPSQGFESRRSYLIQRLKEIQDAIKEAASIISALTQVSSE